MVIYSCFARAALPTNSNAEETFDHAFQVSEQCCDDLQGFQRTLWIIDFNGFSSKHLCKRHISLGCSWFGQHNPERLGAMVLRKPPRAFTAMWSFIHLFLDPESAKRITVCKTDQEYEAYLAEWCSPVTRDWLLRIAQIPAEVGGGFPEGTDPGLLRETMWRGPPTAESVMPRSTSTREGRHGDAVVEESGEKHNYDSTEEVVPLVSDVHLPPPSPRQQHQPPMEASVSSPPELPELRPSRVVSSFHGVTLPGWAWVGDRSKARAAAEEDRECEEEEFLEALGRADYSSHGKLGRSGRYERQSGGGGDACEAFLRCPGGHILGAFETPERHFTCSSCGSGVSKGVILQSCRECDFDICSQCASEARDAARSPSASPPPSSNIHSQLRHSSLTPLVPVPTCRALQRPLPLRQGSALHSPIENHRVSSPEQPDDGGIKKTPSRKQKAAAAAGGAALVVVAAPFVGMSMAAVAGGGAAWAVLRRKRGEPRVEDRPGADFEDDKSMEGGHGNGPRDAVVNPVMMARQSREPDGPLSP